MMKFTTKLPSLLSIHVETGMRPAIAASGCRPREAYQAFE
jgi:hypothetical protein